MSSVGRQMLGICFGGCKDTKRFLSAATSIKGKPTALFIGHHRCKRSEHLARQSARQQATAQNSILAKSAVPKASDLCVYICTGQADDYANRHIRAIPTFYVTSTRPFSWRVQSTHVADIQIWHQEAYLPPHPLHLLWLRVRAKPVMRAGSDGESVMDPTRVRRVSSMELGILVHFAPRRDRSGEFDSKFR